MESPTTGQEAIGHDEPPVHAWCVSQLEQLAYPGVGAPPLFIAHGDRDSLIPVETARLFAEPMRGDSAGPVVYAELPGAQHGFDRFHSIRFERLVDAVEDFAAWARLRGPLRPGK
jgi:acetyl esterase/lipase